MNPRIIISVLFSLVVFIWLYFWYFQSRAVVMRWHCIDCEMGGETREYQETCSYCGSDSISWVIGEKIPPQPIRWICRDCHLAGFSIIEVTHCDSCHSVNVDNIRQ